MKKAKIEATAPELIDDKPTAIRRRFCQKASLFRYFFSSVGCSVTSSGKMGPDRRHIADIGDIPAERRAFPSGTAMPAQANRLPQTVPSLIWG